MKSRVGKTFDSWEAANTKFRITITAHEEGVWTGGAGYIFKAASVGSDNWREIMRFRHNDPVAIPRNQYSFINDQIGYVFMGWMYAVTTDAGSTWKVWNANEDLLNWECYNHGLINDVSIAPDGTGKMKLNAVPGRRGEVPELHTKDYGQHWGPE